MILQLALCATPGETLGRADVGAGAHFGYLTSQTLDICTAEGSLDNIIRKLEEAAEYVMGTSVFRVEGGNESRILAA